MPRFGFLVALLVLLGGGVRPAFATELDGFWMDSHGEVILEVDNCGAEMCAKVVWLRLPYGPDRLPAVYRGAGTIARQARAGRGADVLPVVVNGLPGVVTARHGRPVSIMAFTVVDGRVVEIAGIRDPDRVLRLTEGLAVRGPARRA